MITGPPGVGKTSLAVHWAHRIADRFPDGQLYVNLRGFGPADRMLNPAAALRGFLDAIAPGATVPTDPDEQAARFRSLMAGRRMLLVLDNARDSDQVLPLLPGTGGCLVMITSRHQLTGLIATTGAMPVEVEPVGVEDGHRQLMARLGRNRVRDEPAAVAELVAACAGLPLAIALVSARAATQPQLPLSALAAELREAPGGLDVFGGDTAAADLRTVFSWSAAALSPAAASAFRLLGLHPGPDLTTIAAAALLGRPVAATRTVLIELCRVHLLREHQPGRYSSHDLIASYAAELAAEVPTAARIQALARMIDHYLHTARRATELLAPRLRPLTPFPAAAEPVPVAAVETQREAQTWFRSEHDQLLAMIDIAAGSDDLVRRVFLLHEAMRDYVEMQAHWYDWKQLAELSLTVAGRIGDRHEEARSLQSVGGALAHLGRLQESLRAFEQAADLYRSLDDDQAVARVESNLGKLAALNADFDSAIAHSERALELYAAQDNGFGVNWVRVDLAWFHGQQGDYDTALRYCQQVRTFHREDDPSLLAPVWDTEGFVHYKLGDLHRATECMRQAHDLYRQIGDRFNEADVLDHLGDVLLAQGDRSGARQTWQQAYEILRPTGHPMADTVHSKIIRPVRSTDAMPAG
ncbi:tetratricopeptide repeat protein [Microlunatus soli]|uniref:Predicted ATPase n=1 Tax=Microlunatus soli TaxID=630515 RepID=A0A1H1Z7G3_9ACTN|nr:tetratricopeptide repeat protein [Microlunatus soli]SDT29563.1 Predicted ATPase [Microlunatus soli]